MPLFGTEANNEVVSLDHGTSQTGYVWVRDCKIDHHGIIPNGELLEWCVGTALEFPSIPFVFERMCSYGHTVGRTTFETVRWQGRFEQAIGPQRVTYISRVTVKKCLCGTSYRIADRQVRAAVIKKFGRYKDRLQGITSHRWQALALAIAFLEGARDVEKEAA